MQPMTDTTPPIAAKKPSTTIHHGITVSDDYAWLRDPGYPEVTDKEVLAHLEAENAWFEARMAPHKPLVEKLFQEMRGRIKEADISVPQKDGDYLYWIEFEEGAEYKKWWRKPVTGGAFCRIYAAWMGSMSNGFIGHNPALAYFSVAVCFLANT